MDTFVISIILPYFFKNSSSRMLFMCEKRFFKLFPKQLTFFMGANLLLSSLRQSSFNSYRDSESNPYSTKVISLMVAMLLALNPVIQYAF